MLFDYMYSTHRWDYVKLSFRFWTTPRHVYQLAHGLDAKTQKDSDILHELHDLGIIHRHRSHRHSEDSQKS